MKLVSRLFKATLFSLFILLFVGCSAEQPEELDEVRVLHGAGQCAFPGEKYEFPVLVQLRGRASRNWMGAPVDPAPIPDVRVKIVAAPGSDLTVSEPELVSDAGGSVSFTVTAGRKSGDQYLWVIPAGHEEKRAVIRFVSGLKIEGADNEILAGRVGREPLRVRLHSDGKPVEGVPVRFDLRANAEGADSTARILTPETVTGSDGSAETRFKMGSKTGVYNIGIEVQSPEKRLAFRSISVRLLGFNPWAVAFAVLGGLAIFVYGMKIMSDGIRNIAGENMKRILRFFASNRCVGLLAGTVATAVLQSSGATTVMVIGFINAGLLNLSQAIGIIFGANIGTTVTAQIISFNLYGMVYPTIIAGLICLFSKKQSVSGWGMTLLGFGLLFMGMQIMSGELATLGEMPSFKAFFEHFNCQPRTPDSFMPIGAVLGAIVISILATVLMQSSSATTGVILALASGGLVNFYTSVPLLIGSNIGSTVTAQIAAISANRVGKQAALAHTLFNLIGGVLMVILFYIPYGEHNIPIFLYFVNAMTPGNAFAAIPQNIERHIATAHTMFNVVTSLLLLPFVNQLARLCNVLLPIRDSESARTRILEPSLLRTPSIALKQTTSAICTMVEKSWRMIDTAVNAHFLGGSLDPEAIRTLEKAEEEIDSLQAEVTSYLVKLTRQSLTEPQSELVPLLMHCTNDAERIADHTEQIIALTRRLVKADKKLSDNARKDISKLWEILDDQAQHVISGLNGTNMKLVKSALKDERKVNRLADKFEENHIDRLRRGKCTAETGVVFIEMLGELAKIGDRLTNISERTPEIQKHYVKL